MKSPDNTLFWVKICDPSQRAWPALEHILSTEGIALGDFPLINKSFNLSYAGTDR